MDIKYNTNKNIKSMLEKHFLTAHWRGQGNKLNISVVVRLDLFQSHSLLKRTLMTKK